MSRTKSSRPAEAVVAASQMQPAEALAETTQPPEVPEVEPPTAPPAPLEPLEQLLRRVDVQKAAEGITAVRVTHPDATTRVWPGVHSGIHTAPGPVSVLWSDGSTE